MPEHDCFSYKVLNSTLVNHVARGGSSPPYTMLGRSWCALIRVNTLTCGHGGVTVSVAFPRQVEATMESYVGCHSTGCDAGHESPRQ